MTPPPKLTVDYHVNYRGPNYLTDVWYLCGAFDNLAEAQVNIEVRVASDLKNDPKIGSEWRLVAVHEAQVVAIIEHLRLTEAGVEPVVPSVTQAAGTLSVERGGSS
ncbi:hypothetical protein [Azospirillum sp.]|uniref:hypothetical protein n=1 Tax=Azospirillum sp. TaxID=34012 RepID=UPI003D741565